MFYTTIVIQKGEKGTLEQDNQQESSTKRIIKRYKIKNF